jgi:hypothetical protein
MKTYKITTPNTKEMSAMVYTHKSNKAEALEYALWEYNSARAHDGLDPLVKLPRGTKCEGERVLYIVQADINEIVSTCNSFEEYDGMTLKQRANFECREYSMAAKCAHYITSSRKGLN